MYNILISLIILTINCSKPHIVLYGCMDPNALSCMEVIDPLYFPECSTCDNGIYDPNIVGGETFCDWFMDAAEAKKHGIVNHLRVPKFNIGVSVDIDFE